MDYPSFGNHFRPRTRVGRRCLVVFLLLFSLAEPPVLFLVANRIQPFLFGHPFLYVYLSAVYAALIAVLLYAHRRGL